ncbi:PAH-inducible cytochrome P450 monooxygenase [Favolaschia claudopus]|uniref:PAH-inducible cytochrome P450 monooxygenase n=1 Tax=Favolaschia claudopus TaxID=2862362 RepID=A0AAW0EDS4_9AGAR
MHMHEFLSDAPFIAGIALSTLVVFIASKLWRSSSMVDKLPGPPSSSWLYGNMLQLVFPRIYGEFEFDWQKKYGTVYRIKGVFGENLLIVSDPTAIQHIMNNHSFIRAPIQWRKGELIFGRRSVYCAEGDNHKRIRAALSPGFAPTVVRGFVPIFIDAVTRIVREWEKACSVPGPQGAVNVCHLLDHATLDVISEAALGLPLNTVAEPSHPLARTHLHVLKSGFDRSKSDLLSDTFLPYIPTFLSRALLRAPTGPLKALAGFRSVTDDMSAKIIGSTKHQNEVEDSGKDVLSILIQGLAAQSKKALTPEELAEQIRVILLAGQDTSADALAWCLYELAKDPNYQTQLRSEIELYHSRSVSAGGPMEYDTMPLLNAFLKEILRFYPAGPYLERVAAEDLMIPLSSEVTMTSGKRISQLQVRKGQYVAVAIASFQRLESLWGADAGRFRASRWLEGDPCGGNALGPYAHLMTFSGGYRVCAGWRFALLEMQVFLAELVRHFSFALPEDDVVRPLYAGVLVPITKGEVKGLPLLIERV